MALTLARAVGVSVTRHPTITLVLIPKRLITSSFTRPSLLFSRRSLAPLAHAVHSGRFNTIRCLSNRSGNSAYSPLNSGSIFSDRPPTEMAPLFPGRDYQHWLIVMDKPGGEDATKQQMIDCYIQTLAKVVGSEEEAKKKIYNVSCDRYFRFGCELDEETSNKLEGLPGVLFVLPDSYVDPENKDYGGGYRFMHGMKSPTMSTQIEIVDALRVGERRRASSLLLGLAHGNHSLKADDFLNILAYCAKSPDPLFVMETWKVMEEKEISLDNRCHILMVQSLCKGGYLDEVFNLINYLGENHGIYPSLPAYNNVLRACADAGSIIHANQCLDQMEQRMVGKNRSTYVELVKLAVWQQSLPAVHELWKDFSKHYSSSIFPLRKFIWSFARLGDMKSALEVLHHMVALVTNSGIFIDEMSKGKFNSSSLDIPLPSTSELSLPKCHLEKNEHSAPSISCKEMDRDSSNVELQTNSGIAHGEVECTGTNTPSKSWRICTIRMLKGSFDDLIHACAQCKNCALAEQLMLQMQNLGLEPTRDTYDGYIRAVIPERGFNYGLEVLQKMLEKNLKPRDSTLVAISLSCSKALELDLAEYLLAQISECQNPVCFNAILVACDRMNQPERAVRVLAKMRQIKTRPDVLTYEVMFSLFGTVNGQFESGCKSSQAEAAKRIKAIELDMEKNGIQHSLVSMKNLLQALGNEGMINELIDYLFVAENLLCNNNTNLVTELYNVVLHSLVDAHETKVAIKIFKNMKLCGVQPDAATYSIMTECCFIIKCVRSACAVLSLMIRDGLDLQTIMYTNMIKVLMACKDFDEALDLLDQARSDGIQPNLITYNEIVKMASRRGRIDVVELAVQQMHVDNIRPDTSTCYSVFSVYAMSGFHNTALEALQVLAMRMILKDNSIIEEHKRDLEENFIYAEDAEAEERILQSFWGPEETVTIGVLLLRFCALLGCPISWSPEQSPWAKRLSAAYHARNRTGKVHLHS